MDKAEWETQKQQRADMSAAQALASKKESDRWRERYLAAEAERKSRALQREHDRLVNTGRSIVQAAHTFYIDLDVEADGKPGYGSLRSVGAITPGGETFYREIIPSNSECVPSMHQFCEDYGLQRERLMEEGMPVEEAMYELDLWVHDQRQDRPVALAAFNAGFDHGWVDLEMTKAGIEKSVFGNAGYCLKSLAMAIPLVQKDKRYTWANTTKTNLPELLVPQREFTHYAPDDASWQQELHFAMVGNLYEYETPIPYTPTAEDLMGW